MTSTFDIVQIYNNAPLVNLTKKYETVMVNKINTVFTSEEQQLFIGGFFGYKL